MRYFRLSEITFHHNVKCFTRLRQALLIRCLTARLKFLTKKLKLTDSFFSCQSNSLQLKVMSYFLSNRFVFKEIQKSYVVKIWPTATQYPLPAVQYICGENKRRMGCAYCNTQLKNPCNGHCCCL